LVEEEYNNFTVDSAVALVGRNVEPDLRSKSASSRRKSFIKTPTTRKSHKSP